MSISLWGGNRDIPIKSFSFPGGERQVSIVDPLDIERYKSFSIIFQFQGSDDIIDLMLLVDAIKRIDPRTRLYLQMKYVPFGRQDRAANAGEAHSLKVFATMINSCNFERVQIVDPHSDVTEGLFDRNSITKQEAVLKLTLGLTDLAITPESYVLVSPDGGALKKIFACAKALGNIPVVRADKSRDTATGNITGTYIVNPEVLKDKRALIVDDICDGGYTFIKLAEEIRRVNPTTMIILYVTHGIFSKGLEPFEGIIDLIICPNILNTKVKDIFGSKVLFNMHTYKIKE